MNKEQEKFWKILSEPYVKNCDNCKYDNTVANETNCRYIVGNCNGSGSSVDKWIWDGKIIQ